MGSTGNGHRAFVWQILLVNIEGKVWGSTALIAEKNNVEIHRIEIKEGGYCSKHKHNFKVNLFYCESGCIDIIVWKNDYDLVDVTTLRAGEMTTVPAGEYHRFECKEPAVVYEIYWVELPAKDIEREDHGG